MTHFPSCHQLSFNDFWKNKCQDSSDFLETISPFVLFCPTDADLNAGLDVGQGQNMTFLNWKTLCVSNIDSFSLRSKI